MTQRRKDAMDLRKLLHYLRQGASVRETARALRMNRRTVEKYRQWAQEQDLLEGELPPLQTLAALLKETLPPGIPPQNQSTVAPYHDEVVRMRQAGVEMAAIHQRLRERGFRGTYNAVRRYVRKLEETLPALTVRVETEPGAEAQVDFGYAGKMIDPESGQERRSWAFVMTLSWSRHQYVEFVWNQTVATWLRCHVNAFAYFGGVPQRLVIDNLKAGITRACWEDPQVQHAYGECAEHYGFLIAPCRPAMPQHKGKVEQGGVHYVKRNFLGGREPTLLTQANRDVLAWCETTAGLRTHGTTKEQPFVAFEEIEKVHLQPLPAAPYDMAEWKLAKLHRDCHVVFDNSYYSAPYRLAGQQLRVRGGMQTVRIFTLDYQLVASHDRAMEPGQRFTHPGHLPPELLAGLTMDRESCRAAARDIGPATMEVVHQLLDEGVVDRLPSVRRLLKLRERFGDHRLEAACARALRYDDPNYRTVKKILTEGQDAEEPRAEPIRASASIFVRTAGELVGHLLGGAKWS